MLTGHETGFKKTEYNDIQAPLELLMTPPQDFPSPYSFKGAAPTVIAPQIRQRYSAALKDLSGKYLEHYNTDKQWEDRESLKSTHQMITDQALSIINRNYSAQKDELIYESSGPDRETETIKFVMEGHFCGRISAGSLGNFLQKYMPPEIFAMLAGIPGVEEHLKETALSNIGKYSQKFIENRKDIKSLAWTLHFLQDITAPHHAGNIPAIIPFFIKDINEGNDTHSGFEEFANNLMKEQPDRFNEEAVSILQHLRKFPLDISRPGELGKFGQMIFEKSIGNVNSALQGEDTDAWTGIISRAIPLAIASSAAVLEKI